LLRWLHRYLGAVIAAFMFVLAASGGMLIFKDEIWRLAHPSLAHSFPPPSAADLAAAFTSIDAQFGDSIRMIRTPREAMAAYHVYLDGAEALIDPRDLGVIDEWAWHESFTGILSEIHFHLAAGEPGNRAVGALGVVLALMALSGAYLWWPARRQFRWRSLAPRDLGRGTLIRLHRDIGVWVFLLLVLFGLTGAGVVFSGPTRALFHALLGPAGGVESGPTLLAEGPAPVPDERLIARAQAALPGGRLMSWSPPGGGSALHYFRFRMPGEVHPNGRSTVHADAGSGEVVASWDASRAPLGERSYNWLYSLHAVRVGGWAYRMVAAVTALALMVITLSGLIGFIKSWRRRPR
jgi:uncharacterized iron-regulated membrane protein